MKGGVDIALGNVRTPGRYGAGFGKKKNPQLPAVSVEDEGNTDSYTTRNLLPLYADRSVLESLYFSILLDVVP